MTGIQIGKAIKALLAASTAVTTAVSTRVFPIVSKEGTSYPFIVYRRGGIDTQYTKDGRAAEVVSADIVIAATSYATSVELADNVRAAIEGKTFVYSDALFVKGSTLVSADEDFFEDSNVYTQTLTFNFYL